MLQLIELVLKPIGYISRKLTPAPKNYSNRELLAICKAVEPLISSAFCEGEQFHIVKKHKPLIVVLTNSSSQQSTLPHPRQMRYLGFIDQFTSDNQCIKGVANTAEDTLSRLELDYL